MKEQFGRSSWLRVWSAGRSDLSLQLLTVFSLAVAFVCLASSLLVVTNVAALRDRWAKAGRATVYLQDDATEEETMALQRALQGSAGVRHVRFVSKTDARREILHDERDSTLAALPASAFPASLELDFDEHVGVTELEAMKIKLSAIPSVDSVETYKRWTERLSGVLESGVAASLTLAGVVLAAVVSLIASTMKLLLHRRRIEVEVLKLVGASNAFVRRPFVIEGAAQGAAGAGIAILLVGALFLLVRSRFDGELSAMLGMMPTFLPLSMIAGMMGLGAGAGGLTAHVSLRRMVQV